MILERSRISDSPFGLPVGVTCNIGDCRGKIYKLRETINQVHAHKGILGGRETRRKKKEKKKREFNEVVKACIITYRTVTCKFCKAVAYFKGQKKKKNKINK